MKEHFQNQLGEEKSAYLLKHADSPINWQAWDEEAFRDSVRQDKPIFLSIGYPACHWCHVMQQESFSDSEVAEIFNRSFICIKIDSEELVTVDRTYMKFAQALMNGSGGWPLNIFLTPERKPFYAVTYLPKRSSQGLMGIIELGEHIESLWQSDEKELLYDHASSVVDFFRDQAVYKGSELFDEGDVYRGIATFFESTDPLFGGMKNDPKFVLNYELETLMKYGIKKEEGRCEYFVRLTLDKMRDGGIYDQICGGFARYAIDPKWKIPHFEKMLIDNVLLASCYLEAYVNYGVEDYKKTAIDILGFIERDLYVEGEGFRSSIDADQDGIEGKEFTFSHEELSEILNEEELRAAERHFGVDEKGNFHGRNVLQRADKTLSVEKIHEKIFAKRVERRLSSLINDRKMLTSLNVNAVKVFVKAAALLDENRYFVLAKKVLDFMRDHLIKKEVVFRRYCDGEVKYAGVLDDYVGVISMLLTFYHYTKEGDYLSQAEKYCQIVEENFGLEDGPYSDVPEKFTLFYTRFDLSDKREPSANSIQLANLLALWEITEKNQYLKRAEDVMKCFKVHEGDEITSMHMLGSVMDFLEKKESSC